MVTAASITREEALWAQEVARVLEAAPTMAPDVRAMVGKVLASLASDATMDPAGRRDARALLDALRQAPPAVDAPPGRLARSARGLASLAFRREPRKARNGLAGLPA